jgi:N-acetylmuramoyl-L-alanine amidase
MFLICLPLQAQQTSVDSLRLWAAPDHTRLVFDTSAPVEHSIFSLKKPDRLVIDIGNSKLKASLAGVAENDPLIKNLRSGVRERNGLRVVLDLRKKVKAKSFVLQPNRQYGYRLVVDLYQAEGNRQKKENKSIDQLKNEMRDVVIAIDAGHGGEDPGARGRYGTREKDVVLAISKKLAALIDKEKGMRAVMIRRGDYYLSLKKRTRLARDSKADLFISIHADAFRDRRVKGSSVYTLSRRGASSEAARWLADRENSADLVGGVELKDKDDVLASVLLDLSQTATQQASHEVAEKVLGEMRQVGKTHKRKVQRAGFVVLKSPDVPSILVETAFISNPDEEKRLKNPAHQRRLANSIMKGIRSYFRTNPPPGTLLANRAPRKHVISRGDTLAMIAKRYHVSVASIRDANNLSGDLVRVGQVLEIPRT